MKFLRYPGGKSKLLFFLANFLPQKDSIKGEHIEPFVGGSSVFLYIQPERAILSDLNRELIDLYKLITTIFEQNALTPRNVSVEIRQSM